MREFTQCQPNPILPETAHCSPPALLLSPGCAQAGPAPVFFLTVGILQDAVDEHWVFGDPLSHQENALLNSMPLQDS